MRTITGLFTALALGALLLTGCVNEEPPYKKSGDDSATPATTGYLNGKELFLNVIADGRTDIQDNDTEDATQTPPAAWAATRAGINTDNYRVQIVNTADQSSHFEGSCKELTDRLAEGPMELPIGNYQLKVLSCEQSAVQAAAWDAPIYGATHPFSIRKDETTSLGEIVCTLQNIKVTLLCSADLADQLADNAKAVISLGNASLSFTKEMWDGQQAAYFMPAAEENDLEFQLEGSFTDGGEAGFSRTISGVKAGQWRKIELVIAYADQGNGKFDIQVDGFLLDGTITINGTEGMTEEAIEQPGGQEGELPTIVMQGWDIAQPYPLDTNDPVRVDITASNGGIRSLLVRIESSTLEGILVDMPALLEEFDLCTIDASSPEGQLLVGTVGFQVGTAVKDQPGTYFEIPSTIIEALKLLSQPGESHRFHLTVTDNAGGKTAATLTLVIPE